MHSLFPAHAGVFPSSARRPRSRSPLPRARGGISITGASLSALEDSSPRTRGYFRGDAARPPHSRLFPAHAGVFPWCPQWWKHAEALPRARGGISKGPGPRVFDRRSSPRTRGYFQRAPERPANVPLPRARGGISRPQYPPPVHAPSSPRTRGYFRVGRPIVGAIALFPAHAGVFPNPQRGCRLFRPLPRARGGISAIRLPYNPEVSSSPRTRGYFLPRPMRQASRRLFPAHAGVFLDRTNTRIHLLTLPRARGGISTGWRRLRCLGISSPRTRGYFALVLPRTNSRTHTYSPQTCPPSYGSDATQRRPVRPATQHTSHSVRRYSWRAAFNDVADEFAPKATDAPHHRGRFSGMRC